MATTLPALSGTRAQQVAQLAAWIDAQTGNAAAAESGLTGKVTYGQEFTLYADQYPDVPAAQAYAAWLITLTGSELPQVLAQGLSEGGQATAQLSVGAAKGAAQFGKDVDSNSLTSLIASAEGFLSALSSASFWERAAEVIIGIVLIAAGVAKITKAVPIATKIAGVVK